VSEPALAFRLCRISYVQSCLLSRRVNQSVRFAHSLTCGIVSLSPAAVPSTPAPDRFRITGEPPLAHPARPRTISLLAPIYEAQFASIRTSRVKAMDETPIKAGRAGRGKMKTGYFWPVYGEADEVCFPYCTSAVMPTCATSWDGAGRRCGAHQRWLRCLQRLCKKDRPDSCSMLEPRAARDIRSPRVRAPRRREALNKSRRFTPSRSYSRAPTRG